MPIGKQELPTLVSLTGLEITKYRRQEEEQQLRKKKDREHNSFTAKTRSRQDTLRLSDFAVNIHSLNIL